MNLPEGPMDGKAATGSTPPAVSDSAYIEKPRDAKYIAAKRLKRPPKVRGGVALLTKRSEFLACARARKQGVKSMMVQGRNRGDEAPFRVGYTCSKKVGNAVARARAKRRMREVARLVLPTHGKPGWDYVLIGRAEHTDSRDFEALQQDLIFALKKIHSGNTSKPPKKSGRR
ncbi:MAG: ribonuclease P protein component [Epibacterium sp.]|nr:ribonuclease P protein component [Epibacterium sp.]NQX74620.1 ribonuclease P protein component [Epibacterium sp.]